MGKVAFGVSPTDDNLQGYVSMLIAKLRGEWGTAHGIRNLEKIEGASRGGLYWEVYQGEISEQGIDAIQRAVSDFTFAEMEGIKLPQYLLTHPAAKAGFRVEINGKPIRTGGGLR